jgi:hypothetical protein
MHCTLPNVEPDTRDTKEWHEPAPSWAMLHRADIGEQKIAERAFAAALAAANRETATSPESQDLKGRFARLADEWSQETGHISSVSDLIGNAKYQQIIELGWPVLPYLLDDLERKKRFWFPALAAITGLRPFDPGDASNYRRMTDAWLRWGRRKGLI